MQLDDDIIFNCWEKPGLIYVDQSNADSDSGLDDEKTIESNQEPSLFDNTILELNMMMFKITL